LFLLLLFGLLPPRLVFRLFLFGLPSALLLAFVLAAALGGFLLLPLLAPASDRKYTVGLLPGPSILLFAVGLSTGVNRVVSTPHGSAVIVFPFNRYLLEIYPASSGVMVVIRSAWRRLYAIIGLAAFATNHRVHGDPK
jgi:hypothetical protein